MRLIQSWKFFKTYRQDPLGTITTLLKQNDGRAILNIFGKNLFITSKAEDVNYVLKENAANYLKGRTTQKLQVLLGQGLITAEGETWRKQHKLIRPLMNTRGIIQLVPKMEEAIEYHFKNFSSTNQVDVSKEMTLLTWRIVLNTLFSVTPEQAKENKALDDILDAMEAITKRTRSLLPIPFWVPTQKNRKLKKTILEFDRFVYSLIKKRDSSDQMPNDLLSLLLKARDGDQKMSEKQIRDEMITFMMAGHETVANSMTWLMILLSENPAYFEKLQTELEQNKDITSIEEQLTKLHLHKAAVDESQRLYPPVWIFMRESISDDNINGVQISKKTNVVVVPFASHRSNEYWDRPEVFYPERFYSEKNKPGAYFPFGLGPRACIGFNFATYESILILKFLIKNFRWKINHHTKQNFNAGITLRPISNTEMTLERL